MKKGIILLISILFIALISLIILKNLDDSEKFLQHSNMVANQVQTIKIIEDVDGIIEKLYQTHKNDFKEHLATLPNIPISYENIDLDIKINTFDEMCNINKLDSLECNNLFAQNNINLGVFQENLNNFDKNITTNKQKKDIIRTSLEKNDIGNSDLINSFSYMDTNNTYLLNYDVSIDKQKFCNIYTIYKDINTTLKAIDFEINFK